MSVHDIEIEYRVHTYYEKYFLKFKFFAGIHYENVKLLQIHDILY